MIPALIYVLLMQCDFHHAIFPKANVINGDVYGSVKACTHDAMLALHQ